MLSAANVVAAMQQAEAGPSSAADRDSRVSSGSTQQQAQHVQDELRSVALRMRLELPLKERTIHLQTFKFTFTGQQAVDFLQQQGMAGNQDVAVDLCQRMLSRGLFKSIYHREVFLPDGEVYRFSSSFPDNNKQKGRIPGSITSTGLYKEIAKIGKTAAQPFKNIQLSLNDTFTNLGSLSIPAAAKPGQLVSSLGGSRPRSSGSGAGRMLSRRSQTGKLHHMYSDSVQGLSESNSSLAALVNSMDALQASVKESTSLLRLDLQQHTALLEHLVVGITAQQDSARCTQLLMAINASAALLLLGCSGGWTAAVAAGCMLSVLLYVLSPAVFGRHKQHTAATAGELLRRSSLEAVRGHKRQLSQVSRTAGGAAAGAGAADVLGEHSRLPGVSDDGERERESDDVEDLEDSIPYSEDFDDWPDAPVMLCPDPAAAHQAFSVEESGPCRALTANGDPIPFETALFKGVVAVYIRHLPTTPSHLFKGKKRLAWVALQGTFKQAVSMDHLVYGMEFDRQLSNLPAPWFLENMLLPLARKISPSLRVGTLDDPFFFSPMITASQVVNVSLPGQAPELMEAKEDTRLLQQELGNKAGDGLTVSSRRRYFQVAANRQMCFSTDYVWTFHLWQEYIDYASYMLNMGYSSYDLTQHLDGQPLQVMAKDESTGQQLVSLHVWHANLVRSLTQRLPRRVSNGSHEGAQHREVQVTGGGATDTDTVVSPTATTAQQTPEQQLTPRHQQERPRQQEQEQEQQHYSQPLPTLQRIPSAAQQQQQQQQQSWHDGVSTAHDQQQQQQLPSHFEQGLKQQQQPGVVLPQQQPQRPQHDQLSSQRQARNSSSGTPSLLQQQQQGPAPSSLSDSRLQRPACLAMYQQDSGGSMSDIDGAGGSGSNSGSTPPSLLQLSSLRPAAVPAPAAELTSPRAAVLLHHRPYLTQQHEQLQPEQGLRLQAAATEQLQRSREGSSVSGGDAAAAGSTAASASGQADAWAPAADGYSAGGSGRRLSTAAAPEGGRVVSRDGSGVESPLAARRSQHMAASGSGSAAVAGAAGVLSVQPAPLLQPQSASKKKKEQRPKEEQQRQQLHGLSVMGAL